MNVDTERSAPPASSDTQPSYRDPEAFAKFVHVLKAKGFFKNFEEGSSEYATRLEKARAKFDTNYAAAPSSASAPPAAPPAASSTPAPAPAPAPSAAPAPPPAPAASTPAAPPDPEAERHKGLGNKAMQEGRYLEALVHYDAAITTAEAAGAPSPVYFSNRAAAKIHLSEFAPAVEDCRRALELNPSFVRAYERLASAYRHLGMRDEERTAAEDGLRLEPNNERLKADLAAIDAPAGAPAVPSFGARGGGAGARPGMPPGMPDLGALMQMMGGGAGGAGGGGAPGGMPDLSAMMGNPQMQQMMAEAMNNPMVQQMMGQMMSGGGMPGMGGGGMPGMGGAGAGADAGQTTGAPPMPGAGGPAGMMEMLRDNPEMQRAMENPRMRQIAEEVQRNPMSAMQYMNDPEVMGIIQQLTGSMFAPPGGSRS